MRDIRTMPELVQTAEKSGADADGAANERNTVTWIAAKAAVREERGFQTGGVGFERKVA